MMKKGLILNGMYEGDAYISGIQGILCRELDSRDVDIKRHPLAELDIAPCTGCFGCWIKTPGICVIDDAGRDIARDIIKSDFMILLTPVVFGGYSSELKKGLDRIIGIISPFFLKVNGETHHKPRYEKYPALIAIGVISPGDEDSKDIFLKLVERNAININNTSYAAEIFYNNLSDEELTKGIKGLLKRVSI